MSDDPIERLEAHGLAAVPAVDATFADRLESRLRTQHGSARSARRVWLPRLAVAGLSLVLGVVAVATFTSRDRAIPVVVEGEPSAPAPAAKGVPTAPNDGSPSSDEPDGAPPPTATVAAAPTEKPAASSTPGATVATDDTDSPDQGAAPVEVTTPAASSTPAATARPVVPAPTLPAPPPGPTSSPVAATPPPAPTPVAAPTPTTPSTPGPRATPTVEPVSFEATCTARVGRAQVAAICEWAEPIGVDVAGYRILRSRNGSEAVVVATQRAGATRSFTDRDVALGDTLTYLVQAISADEVIAATDRIVVVVTG